MFFSELKRAFSRNSFKLMILLVSIICLINLWDVFKVVWNNEDILSQYIGGYVSTSFSGFMFFNSNPFANILIIIMPIISAFSFSDSYIEDMKSGIIQSMYTRQSRVKYFINKYFANFIVSGVAFSLPLLLNYILCIMLKPSVQPDPILTGKIIMKGGLFTDLFYSNAHLYTIMWIGIYFLYSGTFASIGLCASKVIKNKYIVLFVPFILNIVVIILGEIFDGLKFVPSSFLYLSRNQHFSIIMGEFIVVSIITFVLFCFTGVRSDVYKVD